jgi:hypothetical protein
VPDIAELFDRVPLGWSVVAYRGRRYGVTKTSAAGGRALAVLARELGGSDLVSANLYLTAQQQAFRPCEMPAAKVVDFLTGWVPLKGC